MRPDIRVWFTRAQEAGGGSEPVLGVCGGGQTGEQGGRHEGHRQLHEHEEKGQ